MNFILFSVFFAFFFLVSPGIAPGRAPDSASPANGKGVPIYLYHRFGYEITDSMTLAVTRFESQLKKFKEDNYSVIPLRQLVDSLLTKSAPLPPRAAVLTVDDGHISVYTQMFPLVRKYGVPVTLFLYPSAISNASYAVTWAQLREMKETGLFDYQGHTYWHPNFKTEKRRLPPGAYRPFVQGQLKKGKEKLEKEFQSPVDLLAWPFGIYDEELAGMAREAGYVAAFSMERRDVNGADNRMALPRYLMADPMGKARGKK
jgi:peptidoglycan/xylan/chitin deacetylase (PgdA/CDA1 family)